jgi:hypothetical protein
MRREFVGIELTAIATGFDSLPPNPRKVFTQTQRIHNATLFSSLLAVANADNSISNGRRLQYFGENGLVERNSRPGMLRLRSE